MKEHDDVNESGAVPRRERATRHLSESDVAGFIDRDLAPDELRRIEIHLDQCVGCRAELVESARVVDDHARRAPAGPVRLRRRWWVPAALAASIAVLFLVNRRTHAPLSPRNPTRAASVVDGEGTPQIGVVSPAENATVVAGAVAFTWHAATADQYRFIVTDESGEPVWFRDTTDTTMTLPAAALRSGHAYFWRVDAIASGIAATTGVHRLTLLP